LSFWERSTQTLQGKLDATSLIRMYPLVGDTLQLCFGLSRIPEGKSIEDLFSEALKARDHRPIKELALRLRRADYYVATALASPKSANCYHQFFRKFLDSNFLTLKYDSLAETALFSLERWYPRDGYGLPVFAGLRPSVADFGDKKSSSLVLHFHGSLCIRTSEFETRRKPGEVTMWLAEREQPLYAFDPSSITASFSPLDRIIAPIPDKSDGLKGIFIRETYRKAVAMVRDSGFAVAIGYSFNSNDEGSYCALLKALLESNGRRLLVLSPDAATVVVAIRQSFPDLSIEPLKATFKEWITASFPGL
jgi:hypothetical protein